MNGEVVGIEFHAHEFGLPHEDWRDNPAHTAWTHGYVRTQKMPKAVYVRFDGFSLDSRYGPGVVAVEASSGRWKYLTHDVADGRRMCEVPMHRIQLPLAPERVRTVQTAQGLSMDSASMLLTRPAKIEYTSELVIFRLGRNCFF